MKIVFDGRWIGRTGIGRYVEELLVELQRLDLVNDYAVLLLPETFKTWQPLAPNFKKVLTTYEVYTWQEQVLLPRQINKLNPDLVHFTSFNLPITYGGPFVTTVHDLTLVNFKNNRGTGVMKLLYEFKYRVMLKVLSSAVKRARTVLVPTAFVKDELVAKYPGAAAKTEVTWEAVTPGFAEPGDVSRFKLPKDYVLYVGNYYPYKNVDRLIKAFVRTDAYKSGTALVLNGKSTYFLEQSRAVASEFDTQGLIMFPGYTSDAELAGLYRGARLFVFPSLSEGFGLPGLEAMAQDLPVLAANASCLPEIYADAASYFEPFDVADMAEKIDLLLYDHNELESLRSAGRERVKLFSWRTMAEQTLAIYRRAGEK